MPADVRFDSLKRDLEKRYGLVMSSSEIAEVVGLRSRSSIDRWLRREEAAGLRLLRTWKQRGRFVITRDLANWLFARAGKK